MPSATQDVRFALRQILRQPAFALLVIVTLGLGVGVNAAIFSFVDALLLRPLPFPDSAALVQLRSVTGDAEAGVSFPDYLDIKSRAKSFSELAFFNSSFMANVTFGREAETLPTTLTTVELFPMLGVEPVLGRLPLPQEDLPGAGCVAVLSHGLWSRRFGSDEAVLGRSVFVETKSCTVVGVMPQWFDFPGRTDLWVPVGPLVNRENRWTRIDTVIGRIKPGVAIGQAQDEVSAVASALTREHPDANADVGARLAPLRDAWVGEVRRSMLLLQATCAFVLLIACANVSNLLLARALSRESEIALRAAFGAGRMRLTRQLATESLVLALLGGALGLLLAYGGVRALVGIIPAELPRWLEVRLDLPVLLFTLGAVLAAALFCGLAPIVQVSRIDLYESLKENRGGGARGGRRRLRDLLVVAEMALALLLLVGAGLVLQSFLRLRGVDPGFDPRGVLTVDVNMTAGPNADPVRQAELLRSALERVSSLPGVAAVGANSDLPFVGQEVWDRQVFTIENQSEEAQQLNPVVNFQSVSPDYFRAMKIPLVAGRPFTDGDFRGATRVVILGARTVRELRLAGDPLGLRVKIGGPTSPAPWLTVVGVAAEVRHQGLGGEPGADFFVPLFQLPQKETTFVVRSAGGDPGTLAKAARDRIWSVSTELGVSRTGLLADLVANSLWVPRLWGVLFAVFSVVGLAMAAAGLYGLMSYTVAQRRREIGIRIATGASRQEVLRLMLRHGLRLGLTGAAAGLAAAAILSRVMASLLYGVGPLDPATYGSVTLLLLAVAAAAAWLPSLRATRLDPASVLREE